jgi:hypothetical protein
MPPQSETRRDPSGYCYTPKVSMTRQEIEAEMDQIKREMETIEGAIEAQSPRPFVVGNKSLDKKGSTPITFAEAFGPVEPWVVFNKPPHNEPIRDELTTFSTAVVPLQCQADKSPNQKEAQSDPPCRKHHTFSASSVPVQRPVVYKIILPDQKKAWSEPRRSFPTASVQRSAVADKKAHDPKKYFATRMSLAPKFKNEEVQATDDGCASVAKLSAWLANDPTSTKKVGRVRRGKNVITKSRMFDKDLKGLSFVEEQAPVISKRAGLGRNKWLQGAFFEEEKEESVIIEEPQSARVSVKGKKIWLQGAFQEEKEESDFASPRPASSVYPCSSKSEFGGYRAPVKHWSLGASMPDLDKKESLPTEARCEIVVDDAACALSVADKKNWLTNAFK